MECIVLDRKFRHRIFSWFTCLKPLECIKKKKNSFILTICVYVFACVWRENIPTILSLDKTTKLYTYKGGLEQRRVCQFE